jgi:sporulation protein YlmC with PRC-barrel domain
MTAAAAALLSFSAYAQTPATPGQPIAPRLTPAPRAAAPAQPKPNPLLQPDVSKIIGTSVYGSDGKEIGDVSTALMQPNSKKIDRLVVRSGGVLGIGGHYVALPVTDFAWDGQKATFELSKTANEVDKMAEWRAPKNGTATASPRVPANGAVGSGSSQPPKSAATPASKSGL